MRGQIRIRGEARQQEKTPDPAEVAEKLDRVLAILERPTWWRRLWAWVRGRG